MKVVLKDGREAECSTNGALFSSIFGDNNVTIHDVAYYEHEGRRRYPKPVDHYTDHSEWVDIAPQAS